MDVVVVGQSLIKRDLRGVSDPRFQAVLARVRAADLAFTNLEATIAGRHGGWPTKPGYFGAAPPMVLDVLQAMGFSALSLSNNHAFDLGPNGVLSTLEEVAARGFLHAGLGVDATSAAMPGFLDTPHGRMALVAMDAGPAAENVTAKDATDRVPSRPGLNPLRVDSVVTLPAETFDALVRVEADLGHRAQRGRYRRPSPADAPGELQFQGTRFRRGEAPRLSGAPQPADRARQLDAIRAARAQSRFVIAYVHHHHWEAVWEHVPDWMRGFAHDCIEAGADLFASHGVPMLQGIEIHRNRPIFYSLGNFIFHSFDPSGWHHDDIWRSVVASCRFAENGDLAGITLDPIVLGGEAALRSGDFSARDVPRLAEADAGAILGKLAGLCAELGTELRVQDGKGEIRG